MKTEGGDTLLQFMLSRHAVWKEAMTPILGALVNHGHKMIESDVGLVLAQNKGALTILMQQAANERAFKDLLDALIQAPSAATAGIIFESRHQVHLQNVDIFHQESSKPSIFKTLLHIEDSRFDDLVDWLHEHYPCELTLKLLLANNFNKLRISSMDIEVAVDNLLEKLNKREARLLDAVIWLDTFRTRIHKSISQLRSGLGPVNLDQINFFSLWHLLPNMGCYNSSNRYSLITPVTINVLRWLHNKKFDFSCGSQSSASSKESLFSALHFSIFILRDRQFPLLKKILTECYIRNLPGCSSDLHMALLANNREAVMWLLERDGPRLASQRISISADELQYYRQYSSYPLGKNLNVELNQITPLGLVCVLHDEEFLSFVMKQANEETKKVFVSQANYVLSSPCEVQQFSSIRTQNGAFILRGLKPVTLTTFTCDTIGAILPKDLKAIGESSYRIISSHEEEVEQRWHYRLFGV